MGLTFADLLQLRARGQRPALPVVLARLMRSAKDRDFNDDFHRTSHASSAAHRKNVNAKEIMKPSAA